MGSPRRSYLPSNVPLLSFVPSMPLRMCMKGKNRLRQATCACETGARLPIKDLGWGFDLPYMLTGLFNQHPRAAIAYNAQPETGDIGAFFDSF